VRILINAQSEEMGIHDGHPAAGRHFSFLAWDNEANPHGSPSGATISVSSLRDRIPPCPVPPVEDLPIEDPRTASELMDALNSLDGERAWSIVQMLMKDASTPKRIRRKPSQKPSEKPSEKPSKEKNARDDGTEPKKAPKRRGRKPKETDAGQ